MNVDMAAGVSTVASGIEKCWTILGYSKHTSLWSVSITPPWQVFSSVVWWLIHDSHTGPALDSVLATVGQKSGIIKEAAWSLLVDARESARAVISWAQDSSALSAQPMGAIASGQMANRQSIWEGLLSLSSASTAVHMGQVYL